MKMKKALLAFFIFHLPFLMLMTGCGYKPSSEYARAVVGEKVSAQVLISMEDPENTVIIRDAVETAIITRFKSSLTDRAASDTHLDVTLRNVTFTPLMYDANGYVIAYRTSVELQIFRITKKLSRQYTARGIYDFVIEPNAIISDQARFEAIRYSAEKALDSFVVGISAEGVNTTR
jgi:hypothetical protein